LIVRWVLPVRIVKNVCIMRILELYFCTSQASSFSTSS
jgi:hypothetical protein